MTGVLLCLLALLPLAGCGEDGGGGPGASSAATSTTTAPRQEADTAEADPGDLRVIESWSKALSEGDVEAAAGYFANPSTAENGPLLVRIHSLEDAVAFNDSLPCGARVIAARTEDGLTSATFRLTERPHGDCGAGAGGTASTSFEIDDGKIVEWRRVDQPPSGGGGGPAPGTPA